MQIVQRKISELKAADYNPRSLSDKQFADLKKSFENLGTLEPAVINQFPGRENIIISGHQRLKIAASLDMTEYPCIEVKFDPAKEKEANIRMNKNTGEWDFDLLKEGFDLDNLVDWGFDNLNLNIKGVAPPGLGEGDRAPFQQMTFTLADEQAKFIKETIAQIKKTDVFKHAETHGNQNANGNALFCAVKGNWEK